MGRLSEPGRPRSCTRDRAGAPDVRRFSGCLPRLTPLHCVVRPRRIAAAYAQLRSIRLFRVKPEALYHSRRLARYHRPRATCLQPHVITRCEDGSVMAAPDLFGTRAELVAGVSYHRLSALAERGIGGGSRLPATRRFLLETGVRNAAAPSVREGDVEAIASWDGTGTGADRERAFMPARVLLQDFTGVPAVVDL